MTVTHDGDGGLVWKGPESLADRLYPLDQLTPDPENARRHPEKNLRGIAGSLRRWGQQRRILAAGDGTIIAGNGTAEAARRLGWTHVSVDWSDLDDHVDRVGYGMTDNRTAELAEWEEQIAAQHLRMLDDHIDLAALGWDEHDMQVLLGDFDMDEHADDDQPRLDQREPVECPACGAKFDPKTGEIPLDA